MSKKSYNLSGNTKKSPHEIYHKNKEHFQKISEVLEHLKNVEQISEEEIFSILKKKDSLKAIPVSIFASWLAPLEAVVMYLKDELGMSYAEISRHLRRDQRTIWLTYRNAKKKNVGITVNDICFAPLEIFADRSLSILENLAKHLHEDRGFSFKEIGEMTNKDNRTIWTVHNRSVKKRKRR